MSKEPLGPVVPLGDDQWFNVVKWVVFATIEAEELGHHPGERRRTWRDERRPGRPAAARRRRCRHRAVRLRPRPRRRLGRERDHGRGQLRRDLRPQPGSRHALRRSSAASTRCGPTAGSCTPRRTARSSLTRGGATRPGARRPPASHDAGASTRRAPGRRRPGGTSASCAFRADRRSSSSSAWSSRSWSATSRRHGERGLGFGFGFLEPQRRLRDRREPDPLHALRHVRPGVPRRAAQHAVRELDRDRAGHDPRARRRRRAAVAQLAAQPHRGRLRRADPQHAAARAALPHLLRGLPPAAGGARIRIDAARVDLPQPARPVRARTAAERRPSGCGSASSCVGIVVLVGRADARRGAARRGTAAARPRPRGLAGLFGARASSAGSSRRRSPSTCRSASASTSSADSPCRRSSRRCSSGWCCTPPPSSPRSCAAASRPSAAASSRRRARSGSRRATRCAWSCFRRRCGSSCRR